MATDAATDRASKDSRIEQWWWLRLLLRVAVAMLAFLMLAIGDDRYGAFFLSSDGIRLNNTIWLASVAWTIGAGITFGLAAWLPFSGLRYLPSRLLLALLALVPLFHFWWVFLHPYRPVTEWLAEFRWFDEPAIQFSCAVLAGVAIAAGFRERTRRSGT